jgi:hypothetical protein
MSPYADEAIKAFCADMKEQGIHVGLGPTGKARCVTCDQPWPCPDSERQS